MSKTEKNFVTLEVGKTYKNRRGEFVTIVSVLTGEPYPYQGDNHWSFMKNGNWWRGPETNDEDLIELVEEKIYEDSPETFDLICIENEIKLVDGLPIGIPFTIIKLNATMEDYEMVERVLNIVGVNFS